MLSKLQFFLAETLYEKTKVYKLNPCDRDCFAPLKPIGRALAYFTTHCPCCTGTRILLAAAAGILFPMFTAWVMGLLFATLLVYALRHPDPEATDESMDKPV